MTPAAATRTLATMRVVVVFVACTIGFLMSIHASTEARCCAVVELRQYTLKPGQRDALIDIFDRYFVESQESAGMTVIGQFRDRRRPDSFVWLRGFADMGSRQKALAAFYGGPVWGAHKAAANATMLDSDDVLLLRPVRPDTAFGVSPRGLSSKPLDPGPTAVLAGIYHLPQPADATLVSQFEQKVAPALKASGVQIEGIFVTEPSRNTFTRLPVREGVHVLAWFATAEPRNVSPEWLEQVAAMSALGPLSVSLLDLEPTSRSTLGSGPHAARATKHDFDFLIGSWTVHNRYLNGRLRHSVDWIEFDARSAVEPVLNGAGNIDRYSAVRTGEPIEGVTLRLFDPATGEWSIYWGDTVRPGVLLPPMVGKFEGNVGRFFGEETVDGRKVLCRLLWTRSDAGSPRWEQAFSDDHGKTWETNWIMTFTRKDIR